MRGATTEFAFQSDLVDELGAYLSLRGGEGRRARWVVGCEGRGTLRLSSVPRDLRVLINWPRKAWKSAVVMEGRRGEGVFAGRVARGGRGL